jgi:predicted nucleic acid-binding protein
VTYLLDTDVVSDLRKPRERADSGVRACARAQRTSDLS